MELMIIDFNKIEELAFPGMNGGTGLMTVRMYNDEKYRIIPTTIHSGGSIGTHKQNSGDDMNYIISGTGKAFCDGVEELLMPGVKVHMGTGTMCILIIAELLQFRFSHTHQPLAVIGLFA